MVLMVASQHFVAGSHETLRQISELSTLVLRDALNNTEVLYINTIHSTGFITIKAMAIIDVVDHMVQAE